MPSSTLSKRGRKPQYGSTEQWREARNARRRHTYRKKQYQEQESSWNHTFQSASGHILEEQHSQPFENFGNVWPPADQDNDFSFAQPAGDEFEGILAPPTPIQSPSLGSASMDISESETQDLDVPVTPIGRNAHVEFQDIDELEPGADLSDIEKLSIRLVDQLLQFQGCCRDCHSDAAKTHADKHETHSSLQTFVSESRNCPDILGSGRIAKREDHLDQTMSTAEKRWTFSGIRPDNPDSSPEHICLEEGDTPCTTASVRFDIDSITGFATSLGIAKGGIRWNVMQMPVSDLQSSLHLNFLRVYFGDSHGHQHSILRPVHEIPHYTIARLVGFEDVSIYILFPRLYREGQQSSRLLDDDFETWMDRVLLPAIYHHCESDQTQHYPSSYQHGKCNATARGVEGRSRKIDALPREQLLMHFVPPEQLHDIWETIQQLVGEPGLQQYQGMKLLLHAKNLKTLMKGITWGAMMTRFRKNWGPIVDDRYMSADFFYDIGKETCPRQTYLSTTEFGNSPVAEILLWKKCCLESCCSWLRHFDWSKPCRQTTYPTAMLADAASIGLEPGTHSKLRTCGLLYSQFYSSLKEVFAAGNQYPFSNAAIETLALDLQLQKTWQHVGAGLSHDPVALIKAYLYAKARCHHGLQGSMQKSFGLREEHRISAALLDSVNYRFEALGLDQQKIDPVGDRLPFVTHATQTILSWCRWNINKFCVGFEMVHSLSQTRWVTWEHTRVMLMFLRCLRLSYGNGQLKESAGCWRDVKYTANPSAPDGLFRSEGLGFESSMTQYGYPWFLEKVDWETMTFKAPHSQYMLFNNPSMQRAYHARYSQIRDVRIDFISVNKIQQLMQQFEGIAPCQEFLEDVLRQLCLCAFRKDVFQHIKHLLRRDCIADALAGKVALCWPSLNRVLRSRYSPAQLVIGQRLAVQSLDVLFAWLWEWKDDQFQRKHWGEKPYRLLYQLSFEIILRMRGKAQARQWRKKLQQSFIRSHWIVPYPQGDRFFKQRTGQQVCWRAIYHAGIHAYYQGQESAGELRQPLPADDMAHYPDDEWKLGQAASQYLPYEIEPEHDLSDLTESEVYEQVSQLAAHHQLRVEEGGVEGPERIEAAPIEIFNIESDIIISHHEMHLGHEKPNKVHQLRRELAAEKTRFRELCPRRQRRTRNSSSSSDGGGEDSHADTSDEEQVSRLARRQRRAVRQKAEELEREIRQVKREWEEMRGVRAGAEEEEESHTDSILGDSGVEMSDSEV